MSRTHVTIMAHIRFYGDTLKFLSRVFLDLPDQGLMKHLIGANLFSHWPMDSATPELRRGLALLTSFCTHWTRAQMEGLALDYTQLFLGLDKTLAAPYESVFLSEEHLLFEKQTLAVRAAYEQHDLQVPGKNQVPDDHLGYELQFVAMLCDKLGYAWQGSEHQAKGALHADLCQFLDQHLLQWLPAFCERVDLYSETGFYRGMALVTKATADDLRQDLTRLT
jgi:TorA maturation chaperone TorD